MKHSKSGLFLIELIIVTLFFSLASTVCIQMFVHAHRTSQNTIEQNHAVVEAQNLAECWFACEGDCVKLCELLSQTEKFEKNSLSNMEFLSSEAFTACHLEFYYDKEWNSCALEDACFVATLDGFPIDSANMVSAEIHLSKKISSNSTAKSLYHLSLVHHTAMEIAQHESL